MKSIWQGLCCLIGLMLFANSATATVLLNSSACASGICDSTLGSTSNTQANAVFDATNFAAAKTTLGSLGVEASSTNGLRSTANASWSDVWSPVYITSGINYPIIGYKYHLDGVIDPRFLDPTSSDNVFMYISFQYQFGNGVQDFSFGACYDGSPCGLGAFLNGVDLTSNILFGTNQAGQTTFSLDYYTPPTPIFPGAIVCSTSTGIDPNCFVPDTMSATIWIDPNGPNGIGNYYDNFFNTFSVELVAADANSMMNSEWGRQTTLASAGGPTTVAEPGTLALVGLGLLGGAIARRRKQT